MWCYRPIHCPIFQKPNNFRQRVSSTYELIFWFIHNACVYMCVCINVCMYVCFYVCKLIFLEPGCQVPAGTVLWVHWDNHQCLLLCYWDTGFFMIPRNFYLQCIHAELKFSSEFKLLLLKNKTIKNSITYKMKQAFRMNDKMLEWYI